MVMYSGRGEGSFADTRGKEDYKHGVIHSEVGLQHSVTGLRVIQKRSGIGQASCWG